MVKTKKTQNNNKKTKSHNNKQEKNFESKRKSTIKKRNSFAINIKTINNNLKKTESNLKNLKLPENSFKIQKEENQINDLEQYYQKIEKDNNFFEDEKKMKNLQMKKNFDFHSRIKRIMKLNIDLNKRSCILFEKIDKSSLSIDKKMNEFFRSLNERDFKLGILEKDYEKFNKEIFKNNFKKEVNRQLKSFKDLIKDIFKEKKEKNEIITKQNEQKIMKENELSKEIEKIKKEMIINEKKEQDLKKKQILEKEREIQKRNRSLFKINEMDLLIKNNNQCPDYDLRKYRNSALLLNPDELNEFSKLKEKFNEEQNF